MKILGSVLFLGVIFWGIVSVLDASVEKQREKVEARCAALGGTTIYVGNRTFQCVVKP